jgi:hypothetical protein
LAAAVSIAMSLRRSESTNARPSRRFSSRSRSAHTARIPARSTGSGTTPESTSLSTIISAS